MGLITNVVIAFLVLLLLAGLASFAFAGTFMASMGAGVWFLMRWTLFLPLTLIDFIHQKSDESTGVLK